MAQIELGQIKSGAEQPFVYTQFKDLQKSNRGRWGLFKGAGAKRTEGRKGAKEAPLIARASQAHQARSNTGTMH